MATNHMNGVNIHDYRTNLIKLFLLSQPGNPYEREYSTEFDVAAELQDN